MDGKHVSTGLEGSEPQPPAVERVKTLCKVCGGREVQPGKDICWCCEDPTHVINDELIKLKAIGLSLVAIAYIGEEKQFEIITKVTDPWEEVEALGTLILEQESKIRDILENYKRVAH